MDVNPVEYLMTKFPEAGLKPEQMRAMLGKFGLSGHHHLTPIVKLSGECGGAGLGTIIILIQSSWIVVLAGNGGWERGKRKRLEGSQCTFRKSVMFV